MPRINEYDVTSTLELADVFIVDGDGGTRIITKADLYSDLVETSVHKTANYIDDLVIILGGMEVNDTVTLVIGDSGDIGIDGVTHGIFTKTDDDQGLITVSGLDSAGGTVYMFNVDSDGILSNKFKMEVGEPW